MSQAAKKYTECLFDDTTEGYIQVTQFGEDRKIVISRFANKNNIAKITEQFIGDKDTYITPNTMYKYDRKVNNIRQFRALYIDIDDNNKYSKSEVMFFINQLVNNNEIPSPSMIVDSGRGLHIYWKIENAPYQALHTWQELEDYLYYKLKKYGADKKATDGARILRLPGTINSKSNTKCKILWCYDDVYSMYSLREKYLNYKPRISHTKSTNNKSNIVNVFNSYTLHKARMQDLETLCMLREYDLKGYRNMFIHCYAYWKGIYTRDSDKLEEEVKELNNCFKEPLKESEIKAILRCIPKAIDKFIAYEQGIRCGERKRVSKGMRDKEGYWYTNITLIERLGITEWEQRHLKTIISKQEKYRRYNIKRTPRNEEGLTPKQAELKALKQEILKLKEKGLNNSEIARTLKIDRKKVSRLVNNK